jgi:hypothetical protein
MESAETFWAMKDLKKQKSGAAQVDTPKPPRNNAWTRTLCCTVLDVLIE